MVSEFDYQKMNMFKSVRCSKNDVQVSSMYDLVNLVQAFLLGLMLDVRLFKAKFQAFEFVHDS